MKTLLFAAALVVPATLMAAPPIQAPVQAPAKAVQAPTQAPVQAPGGKMAAVPAAGGYRSFSYEPGYAPAGPSYGGYNTYRGYRSMSAGSGFHDAGYKVRGNW